LLAKLPRRLNSPAAGDTRIFWRLSRKLAPPVKRLMERRSKGLWSAGGFFIDDLFARRGGDGPVYADGQLVVTRTDNPTGLRFAGEIDISNSSAVGESVRVACASSGNPHIDLTNLSFCDVRRRFWSQWTICGKK